MVSTSPKQYIKDYIAFYNGKGPLTVDQLRLIVVETTKYFTMTAIAKDFGISKQSVSKFLKNSTDFIGAPSKMLSELNLAPYLTYVQTKA